MSRSKLIWRCSGGALLALFAAGIIAPYARADRYAERIRSGLDKALGRRVEFGDARFNLFTGPGFTVHKVVIHEDPAFGLEPFAYVESLEARPRLLPLFRGRIEFASLRLEDASFNLMRAEQPDGPAWNFAALLQRTKFSELPALHVRSGRINFKFGDTKSVFYVTEADLDISPPSRAGGEWRARFTGEPARTDRPARGFGSIVSEGRWRPGASQGGNVELDCRLEKSAMNEIINLVRGGDLGIHGMVSARAHLAGPLSDLHINGSLNVEDVHRWDLLPQRGTGWPFEFEGHLSALSQRLEIVSHSAVKEAPPLSVRFRAADYLSRPHWGVAFNWNRFSLEPLLQLVRHLGAPVPAGLKMAGTLDGAVGYSEPGGWQGQLAFSDAAFTLSDSPPLRFEQAKLLFDAGHIHVPAAVARTSGGDLARLEADYQLQSGALNLAIASESMTVGGLRSQVSLAAVPLLELVESGVWKGQLEYQKRPDVPGEWSGTFELDHAQVPVLGLAMPLGILSANVQLDGAKIVLQKVHADIAGIAVQGDYRYEPGSARPQRLRLVIPAVDAADLEQILLPTLNRKRGLLARAFGLGRTPIPDWLRTRHIDGTVQIGTLKLAAFEATGFRARMLWNGTHVVLADLTASLRGGTVEGQLSIDLRGNDPVYHLASRLKAIEWNSGSLEAEAAVNTSGVGEALQTNLRSDGSFTGRGFEDSPFDEFDSISGCYTLEWAKPVPHLQFSDLRMSSGTEVFSGKGAMQDDGRLLIQLSNGTRQLNMTVTLAQLRVDEGASQ